MCGGRPSHSGGVAFGSPIGWTESSEQGGNATNLVWHRSAIPPSPTYGASRRGGRTTGAERDGRDGIRPLKRVMKLGSPGGLALGSGRTWTGDGATRGAVSGSRKRGRTTPGEERWLDRDRGSESCSGSRRRGGESGSGRARSGRRRIGRLLADPRVRAHHLVGVRADRGRPRRVTDDGRLAMAWRSRTLRGQVSRSSRRGRRPREFTPECEADLASHGMGALPEGFGPRGEIRKRGLAREEGSRVRSVEVRGSPRGEVGQPEPTRSWERVEGL